MLCPNCRRKNASGWKYCIACGSRLSNKSNKKTQGPSIKKSKLSKGKSGKSSSFSNKGISILNSILVVMIILGIITIVSLYGKDLEKSVMNHIDVSKNFDGSDWTRFEIADGNYSVLTPGEPEGQKISKFLSGYNRTIQFYSYSDAIDSENLILFAYGKYPSGLDTSNPDGIFDALMNRSLEDYESQVVEYNDDDFLGHPAVEFTGKALDEDNIWYMKSLIFLKGKNLYMLSYRDRTQEYKGYNALKDSFKIIE
jgi:hypothetical protein